MADVKILDLRPTPGQGAAVAVNLNDLCERMVDVAAELGQVLKRHRLKAIEGIVALRLCRNVGIEAQPIDSDFEGIAQNLEMAVDSIIAPKPAGRPARGSR